MPSLQPGGANALIFLDAQRRRGSLIGLRQFLVHRDTRVVHWPTGRPEQVFSYDAHIPLISLTQPSLALYAQNNYSTLLSRHGTSSSSIRHQIV